ncbi:MAG: hypothetical protein RLZZ44_480 [Bacteroidota bacterium]
MKIKSSITTYEMLTDDLIEMLAKKLDKNPEQIRVRYNTESVDDGIMGIPRQVTNGITIEVVEI